MGCSSGCISKTSDSINLILGMNLVSGGDVENVPAVDMTRRRELASLIDLQILLLNIFHELLLYLLSNGKILFISIYTMYKIRPYLQLRTSSTIRGIMYMTTRYTQQVTAIYNGSCLNLVSSNQTTVLLCVVVSFSGTV